MAEEAKIGRALTYSEALLWILGVAGVLLLSVGTYAVNQTLNEIERNGTRVESLLVLTVRRQRTLETTVSGHEIELRDLHRRLNRIENHARAMKIDGFTIGDEQWSTKLEELCQPNK